MLKQLEQRTDHLQWADLVWLVWLATINEEEGLSDLTINYFDQTENGHISVGWKCLTPGEV